MANTVTCHSCDKRLRVKPEMQGRRVKCPGCGQVIAVAVSDAAAHDGQATEPQVSKGMATSVDARERTGGALGFVRSLPPWDHGPLAFGRLLTVSSVVWFLALMLLPGLRSGLAGLLGTLVVLAASLGSAVRILVGAGKVYAPLCCAQVPLLFVVNYQLHAALGADYFAVDHDPGALDWLWFSLANLLRALDIFDLLPGDVSGNIQPASLLAGALVVVTRIALDLFIIGLILKGGLALWNKLDLDDDTVAELNKWLKLVSKAREPLAGVAVIALIAYAAIQGLAFWDWFFWPLDQAIRVLDIGDIVQTAGWQLHGVEDTFATWLLGLAFRILIGVYIVQWARRYMGVVAASLTTTEELIEQVASSHDLQERIDAVHVLGARGKEAAAAVPVLLEALDQASGDLDSTLLADMQHAGLAGEPVHNALAYLAGYTPQGVLDSLNLVEKLGERGALEPFLTKVHGYSAQLGNGTLPFGKRVPGKAAEIAAARVLLLRLADAFGNLLLREALAIALGKIGAAPELAVPRLTALAAQGTCQMQWLEFTLAAQARLVGRPDFTRLPGLTFLRVLADQEAGVRRAAAEALGEFGPQAAAALPVLNALRGALTDVGSVMQLGKPLAAWCVANGSTGPSEDFSLGDKFGSFLVKKGTKGAPPPPTVPVEQTVMLWLMQVLRDNLEPARTAAAYAVKKISITPA